MAKNDQTPVTARPRMGLIPKGSPIVIPVSQSFDTMFRQRHERVPIRKSDEVDSGLKDRDVIARAEGPGIDPEMPD